jgi:HlyD family secretion protein
MAVKTQNMLRKRLPLILVSLVILIVVILTISRCSSSHDTPAYVTAPAQYANISATVNETGTVNPVTEVDVGTQVSGTIDNLYVDYNSKVKKDQILATINPTLFSAALTQANATYEANVASAAAAQGTEEQDLANVESAKANLDKAVATANLAHITVTRDKELLGQGYIPQSQMDSDTSSAQADDADVAAGQHAVNAAVAQYQASGGQVKAAQAQAQAQKGQVESASYNVTNSIIRSPIDGIVVSRNVSIGQTVAASFQTPTLFVIASNLNDMQVDASVDEADVGQLRVGQAAQITVPAYPNVIFPGTVKQIRVNPIVTNNVVTYDTVIAIHDESSRLIPGMTANITIDVATRTNVLSVPAAALLYRPQNATTAVTNAGGAPGSTVTLWVLRNKKATPVNVIIGYSDNQNVEIRSGDIHPGDRVIEARLASGQATARPGMFGGR